jgi:Fe-S-cluster-containing dehydrogenase component
MPGGGDTLSDQLGFIFEVAACSGCMACVVACQDQNDLPGDGPSFRQVTKLEQDGPPPVLAFLSLSCQHCGDAPCLMACPTGAIFRHHPGEVVDVNRDLCVGCRSCALACPFGAVHFLADGKMAKCNFCHQYMAHGLQPACVRICPTGALRLGPLEDYSQDKAAQASRSILQAAAHQATGFKE